MGDYLTKEETLKTLKEDAPIYFLSPGGNTYFEYAYIVSNPKNVSPTLRKHAKLYMIDCGIHHNFSVAEIIEKQRIGDIAIAKDIIEDCKATINSVSEYMKAIKTLKLDKLILIPIQGRSFQEYRECYNAIKDFSPYIGIGGLIPKTPAQKWNILRELVPYLIGERKLVHVFGISENYRYINFLVQQGIVSCDGRSPYEAAIHGQAYNRELKRVKLNISFNPEIRETLAKLNVLTLKNVMREIKCSSTRKTLGDYH